MRFFLQFTTPTSKAIIMFEYSNFLVVGVVSLMAAISPGPNFCLVLRNSLAYSRKVGFFTALGISMGALVHLLYTLVGIAVVIRQSPSLYLLIKDLGAAYLFYLGLTVLLTSFKNSDKVNLVTPTEPISFFKAISQGFFTNVLNPRSSLFFISLFPQFIKTGTPFMIKLAYAAINWSVTLGWFLLLAFIITGKLLISRLEHYRQLIDRAIGGLLMLLSIILLLT